MSEQAPPTPSDEGRATRTRALLAGRRGPVLALSGVVLIVVGVLVAVLVRDDDESGTAVAQPISYDCPFEVGGGGVVPVEPSTAEGLAFCPVQINGGRPVTGPFELKGKVIGPAGRRADLLLVARPDPRTCDASGKRPEGESFVEGEADLRSADGVWSYENRIGGYDEGVTLGRTFEYVTGPPAVVAALRTDLDRWRTAHPGDTDYPGIETLPAGARVLGSFQVDPGTFSGDPKPCKG